MKVLVVIPAYNEQENIVGVVNNLVDNYPHYDYVVVNDGSKDGTAKICKMQGFNLIDLPVNLGLAGAFQAGLKYAHKNEYDCAIQFDADGQHRAEYIETIEAQMMRGFDIVIGSRFLNEKKSRSLRMLGSNIISFAIRITTGVRISDPTSGMRMFDKKMIKKFAESLNYGPEPDTISYLIRKGVKISEIQVTMDERIAGESYLNIPKSMIYMLRMVISIFFIQNFRK